MRSTLGALGLSVCLLIAGCDGSGSNSGGGSPNPVPAISSVTPATATAGGAAFAVTVTGSNFVSGSLVEWNNTPLATTYQSATSLSAQLPTADLATAGSANLTVVNAAPGGGTSGSLAFTIDNPVPVLTSISPTSASSGSAALTLTVNGSNFVNGSQVLWNGASLTTTYVSSTQLTAQIPVTVLTAISSSTTESITVSTPTPGGGTSAASNFTVTVPSTTLTSLSLPINHLVWDATHASLYASLGGTASNANTVAVIDPVTATVTSTQPAGTDPDVLALAQDNSFLYAGTASTGQILRYSLPSLTPDTSLNLQLPVVSIFGQQSAIAIAVAPAAPHTIATILGSWQWGGPNTGGTWVYDDATPRPTNVTYYDETDNTLIWGANASVVYGGNSLSTSYDLFVNSVNTSGVTLTKDFGYLLPEQYGSNHFDPSTGYIYSDGGRIVDPATGNIIATFDIGPFSTYPGWLCAPDIANGRVFFLGQTEAQLNARLGVTLDVFDTKTYRLLSTLTLPSVAGSSLVDFVRWGNAGLAFTVGSPSSQTPPNPRANTLYLLDGSFVSATATPDFSNGAATPPLPNISSMSPQSAAAGTNGATMTVNGANYGVNSQVEWNGSALQTTYVSATELQATVPAADLTTAGSALVTVSNGSNQLTANSLAFTVTPSSGTTRITAENLAALDIAWDAGGGHLIVPVWEADSQYANSIVAIDPSTGNVAQSAAVDTDPDLVRITSDDASVYTAYSKDNWVTQLALPNLTSPTSFALGADTSYGPYFAIDLQPAPGADATTAITLGVEGSTPSEQGGIVIFDNGTARSTKAPGFGYQGGNQYDDLQWGASDSVLYASDLNDNIDNLYTFTVDAAGIALSQKSNLIGASPIHFDATTGYIYNDAGQVLNPDAMTLVGSYNASGLLAVDSTLNRVFILGQTSAQNKTSDYTLQSFNQTQFTPVSSITLPSIVGTPVAMTRWGTNGLAFVTYNASASATGGPAGMLYILSDTTFVSASARSTGSAAKAERVHAVPHASPFPHIATRSSR